MFARDSPGTLRLEARQGRGKLARMKALRRWCSFSCCAVWIVSVAGQTSLVIEVLDPNPSLLTESGHVLTASTTESVDRFAASLPVRGGVVADGVSTVVLRVRAANAMTFSISPRLGELHTASGDDVSGTTLTVSPASASDGSSWALALFVAPDDLPRSSVRREVIVTASDAASRGTVTLRVENPPVLIVRGVWSSSAPWAGLTEFLKSKGHTICDAADCVVNYGPTQPAPSFDPFAAEPENQFAINHLIEKTANILDAVRSNGLAAAQVDVVAHSLGGLIARARVAVPDAARAYRRRENFQRGDFHKLITIGTPHRGTPAADFLISNRCVRSPFLENMTLEAYMAGSGFPLGRAIEEMRTTSAALTNIGATAVPSHAIVGVAPRSSGTEQLLDSLPGALGLAVTLDEMLGGNGRHDTIVPRESQAGGLVKPAVTFVRGVVHTDVAPNDTAESESRIVWRRVAQLLRAPSTSPLFGHFTALATNTTPATPPCE